MKLSAGQFNNVNVMPKRITKVGNNNRPVMNNSINFTGDVVSNVSRRISKELTVDNAGQLVRYFDDVFGDKWFSQKLTEAGLSVKDDILKVKKRSFWKDDLGRTLLFPIKDVIPSLAEKYVNKTGVKLNPDGWLQKAINQKHEDEARYLILDIFENFSKKGDDFKLTAKRMAEFEDGVTSSLTKTKKNYATRDERTLNRIVTSTVSAMYAGADFYNISMLEKDNKEEARKAQNSRLGQEFSRLAFNAGTTFLALGAFDRYTRQNVYLNSLVIAGSALIAEIASRLISKTPLKPLTPQEAEYIAKARKAKKEQKNELPIQNTKNIQFKANLKSSSEIFSNFTTQDGTFTSLDVQRKQIANEQKLSETENNEQKTQTKKMGLKKILGLAFGGASLYFIVMKALKGDYKALIKQGKILKNMDGEKITKDVLTGVKSIIDENDKTAKTISIGTKFRKYFIAKKVKIDLKDLEEELKNLKESPGGKEISGLIDRYIENIGKCIEQEVADKNGIMTHKVSRPVVSGFIEGVTKVPKTIYDILSAPAKLLISPIIENILIGGKNNAKLLKEVKEELSSVNAEKYADELAELHQLFKNGSSTNKDVIEKIKRRTRNIQLSSAATGDLAHISRTMVTAIGTYFFVNDYRNRVLLESEGKNVEGAKEEMNERIWHKVFNFIINGTLMNIFNTVFKGTVNGSLIGAAAVAAATEMTNEALVRKSICQPILPKESKKEIVDFENEQVNKKGAWGTWSRFFKKITGKKSLTEKAGIKTQKA